MEKTGTGYLRVRASTANGALPVEGASVIVISDNENGEGGTVIATLRTDSSGLTPTISVAAPPKSLSLKPRSPEKPYSTVNIQVTADGYYTVENVGVPVFDGTLSQQNVNLIPRSDTGEYPDEGIIINEDTGDGTIYGGER